MRRSIRVFLIVVVIPLFCFSQNKDQLKEQKKALEKEISYTSTLLNKTKKNKKESMRYINYLDKKISSQERLIQISNIELNLIKKQILKLESKIESTEKQIDKKVLVKAIKELNIDQDKINPLKA